MLRTAAATAILIACGTAWAGERSGGATAAVDGIWQRMERQGEIFVSDIRRHANAVFAALDANGNGTVSKLELTNEVLPAALGKVAEQPRLRGRLFRRLDSDGDGQVTSGEWRAALDKDLDVADVNDDGTVTLSELAKADGWSGFLNMLGF